MANTNQKSGYWTTLKQKLKNPFSKKGQNRSRNHRKKQKKNRHHPPDRNNPSTSSLFSLGCFTTIPKEEYPSNNLDHRQQTANISSNQKHQTSSNQHPSNLLPPPSPSSQSDSISSQHHIPPLKSIDLQATSNTNPKCSFRPHSPSKSKTDTPCFNNTSSKYIHENHSVRSLYSDHPPTNSIKYNMTPTPQTFTEFTDNDYDIYEGVLEFEDDDVINEEDINNYYNDVGYASHGDIEEDDDMVQQRDSVIVKSPHSVRHPAEPMVFGVDRHSMHHPQDMGNYQLEIMKECLIFNSPQALQDVTEQIVMENGAEMHQICQYVYDNNKIMENEPEDNEDEDDDIKLEFSPPHAYNYPHNDAPHMDPHNHHTPRYHAGPLRCTMPSDMNDDDEKSPTCESQQSVLSGAGTSNNNRIRSNSSLGEEPEYLDGDVFHDKYVVGHKINEGGFGSVWHIVDNNLYSKCVKIMELGKDEENQSRRRKACIREYNMTRKAFSDEIIEVELFVDNINMVNIPRAYLIMPYFEGKDLFEFIDDDEYFKKVSTATMLHIFYKIAEKLYDLHYFKKIVHGDLKPENVMILQSHNCDDIEVEIIDYGIAKSIRNLSSDKKYLKSKGHFGTKGYVAPELMRESQYNRKIDVFSAGVVLYNMVTECCLFPKGHKYYRLSQAEYYKYLKKKFKCIKKKKRVMDILYSCLAYDPDERLDVKQLIERYFHSKR